MFARVLAILPFALLVVAGQCNTGASNCCNTVGPASHPDIRQKLEAHNLGGLLGSLLVAANTVVGLGCSPVVGTGANCQQQPVCCENNNFNSGLVGINCSPININA